MAKRAWAVGAGGLGLSLAVMTLSAGAALAQNSQGNGTNGSGQGQSYNRPDLHQSSHPKITADVTVTNRQLLHAASDQNDWLLYGRTYTNQRYSPLRQINSSNVGKLAPAAMITTGVSDTFEDNPIEVNGVLYIVTAHDRVQAYDATSGKRLWTYKPTLGYAINCCGPEARGVAVAYGNVYFGTLDGHVIALNAKSGKRVWKTSLVKNLGKYRHEYSFTMAPQVYDHKVIIGSAGAEWPIRGFVTALDAKTGKVDWKWHTTAGPGQPGGNTWSGNSYKIGGGSVWDTPAIDAKRGLVLFAVGNPNPDNWGKKRKGANAYTDSIVALHVKNGSLAWWHQEVPHDLWDYDADAPVVLLSVRNKNGNEVPAAAEAGKEGVLYVVNRTNGKLIRSTPFGLHSKTMWTVPSSKPVIIYPGAQGGNEWSPESYSPATHLVYVSDVNEAWKYTGHPPSQKTANPGSSSGNATAGDPTYGLKGQHLGGSMKPITSPHPTAKGAIAASGDVSAINPNTGKVVWEYKTKLPMVGGSIATAGNLVFAGEATGYFDALDARSGRRLWHFFLGAPVQAPPITYRVNGIQYVAVAAGGNAANGNPKLQKKRDRPPFGETLAIFRLPSSATSG